MEVEEGAGVGVAPAAERHSAAPTSPAPSAAPTVAAGVPPPATAPREREAGARLSPLVRRLAEEHGMPLAEVERLTGTGTGGGGPEGEFLEERGEGKTG